MSDLNIVVLDGRLTKSMEISYTKTQCPIGKFSIAVNRKRKRGDEWEDEANFFDVVVMGQTVENLKMYLTKGKGVTVRGQLVQDRWTNAEGQKLSRVGIFADDITLRWSSPKQAGSTTQQYDDPPAENPGAPEGQSMPDDGAVPF